VQVDRGNYASSVWSSSASGSFVRAVVTQQQPAYLASLLGSSTVNIGAQAIVEVRNPKEVCALGLGPATNGLTIGGDSEITGNGCALMSDTGAKFNSEPTFVGSGWAVNAVNGCSGGHCDVDVPHNYSVLPATNPLQVLDTKSFNSRTGNDDPLKNTNKVSCSTISPPPPSTIDPKNCYMVPPNSSGTSAYKGFNISTQDYVVLTAPGTYFFYNATIKVTGGTLTCNCTTTEGVTLVLLGSSSIDITGGTVTLNPSTVNTFDSSLNGVLIDDQAPYHSNNAVNVNGGTVSLGGAMYFPNNDVTWNGSVQNANTACTEVIANSITISGNSYLSTNGCAPGTVSKTQAIALVK
jgi:hypothetical protein